MGKSREKEANVPVVVEPKADGVPPEPKRPPPVLPAEPKPPAVLPALAPKPGAQAFSWRPKGEGSTTRGTDGGLPGLALLLLLVPKPPKPPPVLVLLLPKAPPVPLALPKPPNDMVLEPESSEIRGRG